MNKLILFIGATSLVEVPAKKKKKVHRVMWIMEIKRTQCLEKDVAVEFLKCF